MELFNASFYIVYIGPSPDCPIAITTLTHCVINVANIVAPGALEQDFDKLEVFRLKKLVTKARAICSGTGVDGVADDDEDDDEDEDEEDEEEEYYEDF